MFRSGSKRYLNVKGWVVVPNIVTQSDCRKVRDLPFCYICGKPFNGADETDYDHVPPQSIFATTDRNFPIKLKTHKAECHAPLNLDDEIIGQLIALLHGKTPSKSNDRLNIVIAKNQKTGSKIGLFRERNIEFLIRRWVQGFHAALYESYLPETVRWAIQGPFPSASLTEQCLIPNQIKDQHFEFVTCIKRNRLVGNVDRIVANNGKLRYECVWDKLNDGTACCVFALDLYGWADLGAVNKFPRRGCAGLYSHLNQAVPEDATRATNLIFEIEQNERADPFVV